MDSKRSISIFQRCLLSDLSRSLNPGRLVLFYETPLGIMSVYQCPQEFYIIILLFSTISGVFGLRLVSLEVPTAVMQGDHIWLDCTLDLETDELYSIKWYKNDVEFYRFLPRDSPAGQKYDLPGVFVDLAKSKQGRIFMYTTDLQTEGTYRCEASAESPTFQTVEGEKKLFVYVLPQDGPRIQGNQPRYEIGDIVNASCQSGPSKPAATLKWYINRKEAPLEYEILHPLKEHPNGLKTSSLGMTFTVHEEHLSRGGALTLGCTATISQIYSTSSEELILGDKTTDSPLHAVSTGNGPKITGNQVHYRIGDLLLANCTSVKSKPAPELHWYLNDDKVENENVIRYGAQNYHDGEQVSSLGLRLRVDDRHFNENDEIRLKCTATHSRIISTRSDEKIMEGNHRSSGLHLAENVGKVTSRNSCESSKEFNRIAVLLIFTLLPVLC